MYNHLVDRFLKYVKVNTRSDVNSETIPSTERQVTFAKEVLIPDLEAIGLSEIHYNEANGFVTATLPANTEQEVPTIGFIAHIDTADFASENIQPQVHEDYDGEAIQLNDQFTLSPEDFPNLKNYVGQTLITTDGTTLLGSDDKSGIVEILSAVEHLIDHPEIKHGKIRVAFGPDEEIGRGADHFDVEHFAADFAYTMDGGPVGELQYESFNAAGLKLSIQGKNVHPGTAKDTMINALQLAHDFHAKLPAEDVPEKTDERQGFFHLMSVNGTVEEAEAEYIIRDHSRDKFNQRKQLAETIARELNERYAIDPITIELHDQYYNMAEIIEQDMRPVDLAQNAMLALDIKPIIEPIRGGTDGSKISFMGLPTPNIFAGGENFHGRYEYVSVQSMEKAVDTIVKIAELAVK
ncbi:peptidase T [Dolosigranulum pigrum]|uniref:Peptidase T n=1 Tax=Dolosigranulum pigrum TaxID=29394 RepID=A0A516GIT9_9LACT|nr:peptidase T [Dolosigranulum pigrum]QDO91432.1 peptidase T [Dolosigranulum pigrum]QTJ43219.1 peptidase T [Dolosigranulum pigrum]QTJ46634.1 peptidase T [Dolosigranulum pigrum]QTJ53391.1 peptidase T [Dolosigranulum pigrum]QTJ60155.1 peptidase T [Dolosigranulum pigrum]